MRAVRPVWPGMIFEVHDGDTATVLVRVSTEPRPIWIELDGRIRGYNARELREAGGREACEHLRELMPTGTKVQVTYYGDDKYGGRNVLGFQLPDGRDVTETMIKDGYGAAWDGRGAKPVAPWPISTKEKT